MQGCIITVDQRQDVDGLTESSLTSYSREESCTTPTGTFAASTRNRTQFVLRLTASALTELVINVNDVLLHLVGDEGTTA
jgi:hypothetical protein